MSLKENELIIPRVRCRYLELFEPKEFKGKSRYSATLLIPKKDKALVKSILDIQDRMIKAKYSKGVPASFKKLLSVSEEDDEILVLRAYRQQKQRAPLVLGRDATPINSEAVDAPYDGCYVKAKVSFYIPKDHDTACTTLVVVQFVGDGDPLSASTPVASPGEFEAVPSEVEDLI